MNIRIVAVLYILSGLVASSLGVFMIIKSRKSKSKEEEVKMEDDWA